MSSASRNADCFDDAGAARDPHGSCVAPTTSLNYFPQKHAARATVLVSDSFTDIEASHSAGVGSTGYANQPGKHERMNELQAGAVITSMADLALSLRAHPLS